MYPVQGQMRVCIVLCISCLIIQYSGVQRLIWQVYTILDEIILGGQVLETSSAEVVKAVEEISKYSLSLYIYAHVCVFSP